MVLAEGEEERVDEPATREPLPAPTATPQGPRWPTVADTLAAATALTARAPQRCGLRQVGRSRGGRPLWLLSVHPRGRAHGAHGAHALVVAGAHANEPVGAATALLLAEQVLATPALAGPEVTWHFLLCLDPDGAVLNEPGRSAEPGGIGESLRPFFRPVAQEQPEWASSLGCRLPETQALTDVIDEVRPFVMCTLHGIDVGGTWVQLTRRIPGLVAPFTRSARTAGIRVEHSSYDTFFWPYLGPGVFLIPEPEKKESFAAIEEDLWGSTWVAPHRHGGMTAAVEVPMWQSARAGDATPHPGASAAVAALAERTRERGKRAAALLDEARPLLPAGSPLSYESAVLLRSAEWHVELCETLTGDWHGLLSRLAPAGPALLSRGQVSSLESSGWRIPARALATLLTLLRRAAGPGEAGPTGLLARLEAQLDEWSEELRAQTDATWVPVAAQTGHQARTVVDIVRRAPRN